MSAEYTPDPDAAPANGCPQYRRCREIVDLQKDDYFPRLLNPLFFAQVGFALALSRQMAIDRKEQDVVSASQVCGESCPRWLPAQIERPE